MLKSMTGYGRGDVFYNNRSTSIEFKSVNSRYLDVNIRMPRNLIVLEDRIKKKLSESISRGKIDLFLTYKNSDVGNVEISINEELAKKYTTVLKELSSKLSIKDDLGISFIAGIEEIINKEEKNEDTEEAWKVIQEALNQAIINHNEMRINEGKSLKKDLIDKATSINSHILKIENLIPNIIPDFKKKLLEKIKEMELKVYDEERISQEIAIFSDRSSIDEEVIRLKSHMNQFSKIIEEDEPIGRKLDFLIQEMNREANTMASKSVSIELTNIVLEIKNEIEKIREQAQNIE